MPYNTLIGQPVGWCVSDLETSEVIASFLEALKQRSPSTNINVLMTDDGNARISIIILQSYFVPCR